MANHLKNNALGRTAKEYASQSTIHGIAYIFDGEVDKLGRCLWLLVVLGFLALASYFTANSWRQWREDQVSKKSLWSFSLILIVIVPYFVVSFKGCDYPEDNSSAS